MSVDQRAGFDAAGEQFVARYETVRGYIRQELTRANLMNFLPAGRALDVLDFGGGDGRDAIWLAEHGDSVTLLDESLEMTRKASAHLAHESPEVSANVNVIHGDLGKLGSNNEEIFDLVLSHGVLMYELDDPLGQLRKLAAKLHPGGLLSLLTKGYEAARPFMEDDVAAPGSHEQGEFTNRLGLRARAYTFAELRRMLAQVGLQTIDQFGVRVLYDEDRRPIEEVPEAELAAILARETEAGHDPARREQAHMLHLIAVKS